MLLEFVDGLGARFCLNPTTIIGAYDAWEKSVTIFTVASRFHSAESYADFVRRWKIAIASFAPISPRV